MIPTAPTVGSRQSIADEKQFLSRDSLFLEANTNFVESNEICELSSSPENRFFADSPYYDAFVEKEMHAAEVLSATLKDIGAETDSFSKAAGLVLKSFDSLSSLCRRGSTAASPEQSTDVELGPEIAMLQALGKTLEEISDRHRVMFDVISTSLGCHLQELAVKQTTRVNKLKEEKKEADIQSKKSEQEISKYLNGKTATGKSRSRSFIHKSHNMLSNATRRLSLDSAQKSNEAQMWRKRIRVEETTAELKRFQLIKNINDANYERRMAFSQSNAELLESMQTCFQFCSEKAGGLVPHVVENQRKCSHYQNTKKPVWEERESSLIQALSNVKKTGEISTPHNNDGDEDLTNLDSDNDIWSLPYELANVSKFQRPSPRDVLMEGWLYQKCSSIMSLQASWVRRWFILKSGGICYLDASESSSTKFKVKLFDVALCTVRELPDEPSTRFCFELIDSGNKSVILQARGPKELQLWLDRIRTAVGSQLAKENPQIEEGSYEQRRRSSEIISTVVDKRSSHCWDREALSAMFDDDDTSTCSESDEYGDSTMQLMKANPVCADCSATAPDWVSLNLGILVCLECSGVHRSLGCHVSKVRSLTLDRLSNTEATLLLALGNERANGIWEKNLNPERKAQKETTFTQDCKAREDWIRSKYVKKEFIGHTSGTTTELEEANLSRELFAASERGDVVGIATALAHGADLDWKNDDKEVGAHTALRISVKRQIKEEEGAIACTEFLLQNGAKAED